MFSNCCFAELRQASDKVLDAARSVDVNLNRRRVFALAASVIATPAVVGRAVARDDVDRVQAAVARFVRLPVTASCLVVADHPSAPWQASHDPGARLFVGSAIKTFILAQYLR